MGWINMHWGLPQVLHASTNLPHEVALALDKVVEQICDSLFTAQLTIGGVPTMLSLETSSDFTATSWGIQIHERNELESLDKE
jgi:hypothetical protein